MGTQSEQGITRVRAEVLKDFCRRALAAARVPEGHAETIADALVEADLRGIHSHGVNLFARYTRGFLAGELNPEPSLALVRERGATAVLDGDNTLGHVAGKRGMEVAIEKARDHGVGMVAVRNSNHFGAAAYFSMMALPHGMIGYATTNGPAIMAAWGGRDPVLSNNPLSYAIPVGGEFPDIVLDMACTVVARGKIRLVAQRGEQIPPGWATNDQGTPTTNAQEAMRGMLLPIGDYKGYGLALANEILAGVLSGSTTTVDISRAVLSGGDVYDSQRVGHLMMAMDVEAFLPRAEYEERVQRVVRSVLASRPAPGAARVLLPGEPEAENRRRHLRDGIPLPAPTMRQLEAIARETAVELW